jgi:anti-anti-sigma regulatory factor
VFSVPGAVKRCRFARANGIDRVEYIILDLTPVPHMDSMGAHFLEELNEVRGAGALARLTIAVLFEVASSF